MECTPPSAGTTIAQFTGESEQLSSGETTPTQHYDQTQYLSLTMDDSQTWDTIVLANPPALRPRNTSSGTPPGSYEMTRSSQQGTPERTRTGSSPVLKSTPKEPRIEVPSSLSPEPFGSPVWYGPTNDQEEHNPTVPPRINETGNDGDIGKCCPDEQVAEEARYEKLIERHPEILNWPSTDRILMKLQKLLDDGTGRGVGKEKSERRNLGYDGLGTLSGNKGTVGRERVVLVQHMYRTDSAEKAQDNEKFWRGVKGVTPWTYKLVFFGLLCLPTVNAYEEYAAKTAFFWTGLMLFLIINIVQGNKVIALLMLAKIPKAQAYDWTIINQLMQESATITQSLTDWAQIAALTVTSLGTAFIALRSMAALLNTGHALEAGHIRTIRAKIDEIDDQYDSAIRELGNLQKYTKELEAELGDNPSVEKLREWKR
ncbi:hypothetical protein BDD12DRAFT_901607 [Trichophaea hybrida]|nr:hypothetical protein BDD12DRAFT_901607 [Trichophaea hybrida]